MKYEEINEFEPKINSIPEIIKILLIIPIILIIAMFVHYMLVKQKGI